MHATGNIVIKLLPGFIVFKVHNSSSLKNIIVD